MQHLQSGKGTVATLLALRVVPSDLSIPCGNIFGTACYILCGAMVQDAACLVEVFKNLVVLLCRER